jgi:hypothetical protein
MYIVYFHYFLQEAVFQFGYLKLVTCTFLCALVLRIREYESSYHSLIPVIATCILFYFN